MCFNWLAVGGGKVVGRVCPSVVLCVLFVLMCLASGCRSCIRTEVFTFSPSSEKLDNPGRGFYSIYRLDMTDRTPSPDAKDGLSLLEINIAGYRDRPIDKMGLAWLDDLLGNWPGDGRRLIVRVVYDWDGNNLDQEPDDIDVIKGHMAQIGPVLAKYSDSILVSQGLFIGDWGEMHHTKFGTDNCLRELFSTFEKSTNGNVPVAVRTPAQQRAIQKSGVGVFNDAMLSDSTDMGTYDMAEQGSERRTRAEELAFLSELCETAVIGGEVVNDSEYNDFEPAVRDMEIMGVTYLNQDYDKKVLDKWSKCVVNDGSLFDGLDGLTYIERRLGYRLRIEDVGLCFHDGLQVWVELQNDGFAPAGFDLELILMLKDCDSGEVKKVTLDNSVGSLKANESEKVEHVFDVGLGNYDVYIDVLADGDRLALANEQKREADGFLLGRVRTD